MAMRIYVAVLLLALCAPCGWSANTVAPSTRWNVYFSPHGGCTEAVVEALGNAQEIVTGLSGTLEFVERVGPVDPAQRVVWHHLDQRRGDV